MSFDVGLILETLPLLAEGLWVTLSILMLSLLGGLAIAGPVCYSLMCGRRWLSAPALAYVTFFRGTPALVQLFVIFYGLAQFELVRSSPLWIVLREPFWCCVLSFALNSGAYTAEIFRGALLGVPKGPAEAAVALGLKPVQIFRTITAPLAIRLALPPYGNEVVGMLKTTALASTVTLLDVTGVARTVVAQTYAPYEIFISAAIVYVGLAILFERGITMLERRYGAWKAVEH